MFACAWKRTSGRRYPPLPSANSLSAREAFQLLALLYRREHGLPPVLAELGQLDRQLYHLLVEEILRGNAVERVVPFLRRRRKTQHRAWAQSRQRLLREFAHHLVRFIYDNYRAAAVDEVHERELRLAWIVLLRIHPIGKPYGGEMRLVALVVPVDVVLLLVPLDERLFRRHDDAGVALDVRRRYHEHLVEVEHLNVPLERLVQRLAVRMPRLLERVGGLPPDRLGRREPDDERIFPALAFGYHLDGVGGDDRLAASRRHLDRNCRRVVRRRLVLAEVPQPHNHVRRRRDGLVGLLGRFRVERVKERLDYGEGVVLVLLELHRITSSSPRRMASGGTRSSPP